eukprot:2128258-Amphidinium_carterae.1
MDLWACEAARQVPPELEEDLARRIEELKGQLTLPQQRIGKESEKPATRTRTCHKGSRVNTNDVENCPRLTVKAWCICSAASAQSVSGEERASRNSYACPPKTAEISNMILTRTE